MDDDVLAADGREAVAVVIADAFRETGIIRHEEKVGPVEREQLLQIVERQHTFDDEQFVV